MKKIFSKILTFSILSISLLLITNTTFVGAQFSQSDSCSYDNLNPDIYPACCTGLTGQLATQRKYACERYYAGMQAPTEDNNCPCVGDNINQFKQYCLQRSIYVYQNDRGTPIYGQNNQVVDYAENPQCDNFYKNYHDDPSNSANYISDEIVNDFSKVYPFSKYHTGVSLFFDYPNRKIASSTNNTSNTTQETVSTTQIPQTSGADIKINKQTPGAGTAFNVKLKNPLGVDNIQDAVKAFMGAIVRVAIPFIVIFFIYSGFSFVTARGNPEALKTAKNTFYYTIIGTLLILGAWAIINAIVGTINSLGS